MLVRPAAVVVVTAAAGLAVSIAMVVSALAVPATPEPQPAGPGVAVREATSATEPAPGLSGGAQPDGRPARPSVGTAPADLAPRAARSPARPVRLAVPDLDLDLPVRPVGVGTDRQMQLPADPSVLGWYRFGASPAAPAAGAAVVAGHLDSFRFGLGPLVRLRDAAVGDRVLVSDPKGRTLRYVVSEVRRFDRQALPAELFTRTGPPRLHLITCGGAYDPDAGGYQQNLVVTAVPLG